MKKLVKGLLAICDVVLLLFLYMVIEVFLMIMKFIDKFVELFKNK